MFNPNGQEGDRVRGLVGGREVAIITSVSLITGIANNYCYGFRGKQKENLGKLIVCVCVCMCRTAKTVDFFVCCRIFFFFFAKIASVINI
jgi:hypothetical protein